MVRKGTAIMGEILGATSAPRVFLLVPPVGFEPTLTVS
jgi:hypothetical protein